MPPSRHLFCIFAYSIVNSKQRERALEGKNIEIQTKKKKGSINANTHLCLRFV